jgi:GNAT superfamily N-acetyltransferase
MIRIIRNTSDSNDFRELIRLLDKELNDRYGRFQTQYEKYNRIDSLDTVVIAYSDDIPVGCGCFRRFDNETVEIKRMFVKPDMRSIGIAGKILSELEKWAVENEFSELILETGIKQPEAIRFYTKKGYAVIDNFGQYIGNSNSICMSKYLNV